MKKIGEEIRRLERYVARGDAAKALKGYESLLARMPRDPVLRNRVNFLRNSLHRHAPDWQVCTYVISPRAVAEAHIMAERYSEALEILEGLLEADPTDGGVARRVAMVRAMRDGTRKVGIEPTASTNLMSPEVLIESHIAAGEIKPALRVLESLAKRRKHDKRLQRRVAALKAVWADDVSLKTNAQEYEPQAADQPPPLPGHNMSKSISVDGDTSPEDHRYHTNILEGLLEDAKAIIQSTRQLEESQVRKADEYSSELDDEDSWGEQETRPVVAPVYPPKKPAAKSPAAKSPAAKTPAAKTPAAKSPAAKSPAAKTPAAKSPAAKTPAVKPPARPTPKIDNASNTSPAKKGAKRPQPQDQQNDVFADEATIRRDRYLPKPAQQKAKPAKATHEPKSRITAARRRAEISSIVSDWQKSRSSTSDQSGQTSDRVRAARRQVQLPLSSIDKMDQADAPKGVVRATRRQLVPGNPKQQGSAADLISRDPHRPLDAKLLGVPSAWENATAHSDEPYDIHEQLTDTGTRPHIELSDPFADGPVAAADDFEDMSTVALQRRLSGPPKTEIDEEAFGEGAGPTEIAPSPRRYRPGDSVSTLPDSPDVDSGDSDLEKESMQTLSTDPDSQSVDHNDLDLFDEDDEPTILEASPFDQLQKELGPTSEQTVLDEPAWEEPSEPAKVRRPRASDRRRETMSMRKFKRKTKKK